MTKNEQVDQAALNWIDNGGTSKTFGESFPSIFAVIRELEESEGDKVSDLETVIAESKEPSVHQVIENLIGHLERAAKYSPYWKAVKEAKFFLKEDAKVLGRKEKKR